MYNTKSNDITLTLGVYVMVGEWYRAVYVYTAEDSSQLSLVPGMYVDVIEKEGSGWWKGQSDSGQGWFPGKNLTLFI